MLFNSKNGRFSCFFSQSQGVFGKNSSSGAFFSIPTFFQSFRQNFPTPFYKSHSRVLTQALARCVCPHESWLIPSESPKFLVKASIEQHIFSGLARGKHLSTKERTSTGVGRRHMIFSLRSYSAERLLPFIVNISLSYTTRAKQTNSPLYRTGKARRQIEAKLELWGQEILQ